MHSGHFIAAATAIVVLAAGPAFAQMEEVVDSTARGGVKGALDEIAAEEAARIAADEAEAAARIAADTALQAALDAEAAARIAADAAEVANREAADAALQTAIDGKTPKLLRTLVVSPGGPSPVDNCDRLRGALISIVDNAADSPYLVKVEPGLYDCGFDGVAMKPFVDIEGSGQGITTIRGAGPTVIGASNAELRFLSVEADSAGATLLAVEPAAEEDTVAIFFNSVSSFRVTHVTATASAASGFAAAVDGTGDVSLSSVTLRSQSDAGTAAGMRLTGRTSWTEVTCKRGATQDPAFWDWVLLVVGMDPNPDPAPDPTPDPAPDDNVVTVIGSTLIGNARLEAGYTLNIVASQFDGAVTADPGADVNCFAVFDGTFEPRGPDCLAL